jgi:hypothetical protein
MVPPTATAEPEIEEAVRVPPDTRRFCQNPRTVDEWKPWAMTRARVLNKSPTGKGGQDFVTGLTLIDVYDRWAIVVPPGHKKSERVPIENIRLWKKAAEERRNLINSRGRQNRASAPAERWVVYCKETDRFLGKHNNEYSFYAKLDDVAGGDSVSTYLSHGSAWSAKSYHAPKLKGTWSCQYMTLAEARAMMAEREEKQVAGINKLIGDIKTGKATDEPANHELEAIAESEPVLVPKPPVLASASEWDEARRNLDRMKAEEEMAREAKALQAREAAAPKADPSPTPAQPTAAALSPEAAEKRACNCRARYEAIRRLRMEELAAEEMFVQATIARKREEAAFELERMAADLGI